MYSLNQKNGFYIQKEYIIYRECHSLLKLINKGLVNSDDIDYF
jgi:hypothetical protein